MTTGTLISWWQLTAHPSHFLSIAFSVVWIISPFSVVWSVGITKPQLLIWEANGIRSLSIVNSCVQLAISHISRPWANSSTSHNCINEFIIGQVFKLSTASFLLFDKNYLCLNDSKLVSPVHHCLPWLNWLNYLQLLLAPCQLYCKLLHYQFLSLIEWWR